MLLLPAVPEPFPLLLCFPNFLTRLRNLPHPILPESEINVIKVPTLGFGGRYFACSPLDPYQLCIELNIPINA